MSFVYEVKKIPSFMYALTNNISTPILFSLFLAQNPPTNPDLEVKAVKFNIRENSKKHKTDEYYLCETNKSLVIRRGQTFDIVIEFNKDYDSEKHDLRLVFLAGKNLFEKTYNPVMLVIRNDIQSFCYAPG